MDYLVLMMGLTLLMAGWFLMWEFARFLHCAYVVPGLVVSMEPGFGLSRHLQQSESGTYGFFPVIQYDWMGEMTQFTSLDRQCIAGLQIGDQVKLSFSRSRRSHGRIGRMVMLLAGCMGLLAGGVIVSSFLAQSRLDILHILLASFVLAVGLCIIVLYTRQQDETNPATRYPQTQTQSVLNVFLLEPTNVCYWKNLFTNRSQRRRILFSKMVGGCCFLAGMVMLVGAFNFSGLSRAVGLGEATGSTTYPVVPPVLQSYQFPRRQVCSFSTQANSPCGA